MIIDLILDRKDGEAFGERYNASQFYRDCVCYGSIGWDITRAMDYGTEKDVRRELCNYVTDNEYNPDICKYINSRNWLN